jgi:hypothetical protein
VVNFTPLYDMILVLPDPVPEKIGSIFIPQGVLQPGHKPGPANDTWQGTVVAIGPGDRHMPRESMKCPQCRQKWRHRVVSDTYRCGCPEPTFLGPTFRVCFGAENLASGFSDGKTFTAEAVKEWDAGRHPMLTQVGDRVAYPRRASMPGGEFSVTIEGVQYVMFHEEQNAFAVIEEPEYDLMDSTRIYESLRNIERFE